MWTGEGEEVAAMSGRFLGKQEGSRMADKPGNLKGKEMEVEKGGKTGEEQRRGEEGLKKKEEKGGRGRIRGG